MAKRTLQDALDDIEMTYAELNEIANDMTSTFFDPINEIVESLGRNVNALTNDEIRDAMIKLGLRSFSLSEVKEKSVLKAECAEALRKETYARRFTEADGSQGQKDTKATLEISSEIAVEALYNLVANLFKTKVDELHRLVGILQSVSISRMSDAKLTTNSID